MSDVVYSNLRGDIPAKMGIRYEDLKHLNSRIVCCALTGFGMTGPRRCEPGYDYILQGLAGWMDITGEPSGPPTKSGLSLVDYSGGLVAAIAILAAVHAARRDGVGMNCDVSLFDTAISMLTYPAAWSMTGDLRPVRTHHSAHPSLVLFQAFQAADGWIVVACPKEKFWRRLASAMERPELAMDARFASFLARRVNAGELLAVLDAEFLTRPVAEWLEILRPARVPCGPVNTMADALADPQTEARAMVVATEHPRFGTVRQVRSPVRVGEHTAAHRRAPRRNEHAQDVLGGLLGYNPQFVHRLAAAGAFGSDYQPGSQT